MRLPNIISFDETEYGHLPGKPLEDGIQKLFFWNRNDVTKSTSFYNSFSQLILNLLSICPKDSNRRLRRVLEPKYYAFRRWLDIPIIIWDLRLDA